MDVGCLFPISGMGYESFLAGQGSCQLRSGATGMPTLSEAVSFSLFITISFALAISIILEPYARFDWDLQTREYHWEDCPAGFMEVIRDIQTDALAYGLWAARFIIWRMRSLLRHLKSLYKYVKTR